MRVAWWLVALAGCGRIGFDVSPDVGYFIGPNGADSNPGTRDQPWLTFAGSLPRLQPGDRLTLLDGDYDAAGPCGPFLATCSTVDANGAPGAPIIVRADHPRRAHVISGQ